MLSIIWKNIIRYQSRKINFIIIGIGLLILFIPDAYLFPIVLHTPFTENWIFVLQLVLISVVVYIMYYKSVDKDGNYGVRT